MNDLETDVCEDSGISDKNGHKIRKGEFVSFSKENASVPKGIYRSEGFRYFSAVWSKPGIDFFSGEFESQYLELLPLKRWKKPLAEQQAFVNYRKGY